jgi:predicted RecA/RadA family phage recombinase
MATNYVQEGEKLSVILAANANSGDLIVQGVMFGVAEVSGSTNDVVTIKTGGVWNLPKVNAVSTSAAAGANVYWDATNAKTTISATSNLRLGVAVVTSTNTDTTVAVRLNYSF